MQYWNFELLSPHYPKKLPALPKWCCSQTDSYALHTLHFSEHARGAWSDSRGAQSGSGVSTLLTPAARTRKVACNKTIFFLRSEFQRAKNFKLILGVRILGLGNARLLEATFPLQQVFFWSVHLPNKPALSFRFLYFGGGEREDMKKRYWGMGVGGWCVSHTAAIIY